MRILLSRLNRRPLRELRLDEKGALGIAGLGATVAVLLTVAVASAFPEGSPLQPGRAEESDTWSALFLAALGGAFLLYVVALLVMRSSLPRLRLVVALAVAIQLIPLAGPLLLSRDVYSYWDYGRIAAVHDANPYAAAPDRFPHDPAYRAIAPGWRTTRSAYGPAFTIASEQVGGVAGRSSELSGALFRLAGALGMVALVLLAACYARRRAFAAAFVGWNPLLAIHFAGGGHNDVWMMALVLAALVLEQRGRNVLAGVAWALAAAVKWVALGFLPIRLLAGRERNRGLWLGFLGCAALLAAAASFEFGTAWAGALGPFAHRHSAFSLASRLSGLGKAGRTAAAIVPFATGAAFVWLLWEAWRGRPRLGLAGALLLLGTPWLLPWYAAWAVPLAAIEEDTSARWLALALSAYLLPARVPI